MDEVLEFLEKKFLKIVGFILVVFIVYLAFVAEILFPFLATIFLGWIGWKVWVHYIQQDFISGIEWVLLEIIPPRDVLRSPKAMELFITNALFQFSYKGGREEFWQGAVWFWFSLEVASIEGQVHFYIRTPSRIKGLIETQMYAQYPQAQVRLADDYTLAVPEISARSAWNGWGCEFGLLKPEAFPIKTYVDYGLDEDPKEEYKVDPISPVIELFSSIGKGEQMWSQIVVTPSKKMWRTKGTWFKKHNWIEESKVQIKKILEPYTRHHPKRVGGEGTTVEYRTPDFLKNQTTAMNMKTSKLGFETGVRIFYAAKKEAYSKNSQKNMRLLWRQYAKPDCNEFNRINSSQGDRYSGIFTASTKTVMMLANRMLHEFRERAFFHLPLRHHIFSQKYWEWPFPHFISIDAVIKAYVHHQTFVLNAEEIATLWHFPGQILKVPTLERIESKEASPPTNLPI